MFWEKRTLLILSLELLCKKLDNHRVILSFKLFATQPISLAADVLDRGNATNVLFPQNATATFNIIRP